MAKSSSRRRLSLLASSSLVAASLLAGAGAVTLTPGVALAGVNECGDPSANGAAPDVFVCSGTILTGVDYTTTTDGNLTLGLLDNVGIVNGVAVTGNAGENLTVLQATSGVGFGDATVINAGGFAIDVNASGGGNAVINLVGDDGGAVIQGSSGLRAISDTGAATVAMNSGLIQATNVGANAESSGNVIVNLGATTVDSLGNGILTTSINGTIDVTSLGVINAAFFGVYASGTGNVTVTTNEINTVGGPGIFAQSVNGLAFVTTTGATTGSVGITANSGNGGVNVVLGGDVTGLSGSGLVTQTAFFDTNIDAIGTTITGTGAAGVTGTVTNAGQYLAAFGSVTGTRGLNITGGTGLVSISSTGAITGTADVGVQVNSGGAVNLVLNDVTGTAANAVIVTSTGSINVEIGGAATGTGGVSANSNGGAFSSIEILAGGSVEATDGLSYGAIATANGTGTASVEVNGEVLDGGVAAFSDAGLAEVVGDGDITNTNGQRAVFAQSVSGQVTVNLNGAIDSGAAEGIIASSNSGNVSASTGGTVVSGATGIMASSVSGAVVINAGGTITAGGTGASATSTTGGARVNVQGVVSGFAGATATAGGAGQAVVDVQTGSTLTATNLASLGASVIHNGTGLAGIIVNGAVLDGGIDVQALGGGGIQVLGTGSVNSSDAGTAINTLSTSGNTLINYSGTATSVGSNAITAETGAGNLQILTGGALTAGGNGIQALTGSGTLTIDADGAIDATVVGINARSNNGGAVTVVGDGDIAGGGQGGIIAVTSILGGDVTINYSGDVGSAGSNATQFGLQGAAQGSGNVIVATSGNVYTDGAGAFGAGLTGLSTGAGGNVSVSFTGTTLVSGTLGMVGAIFTPASGGNVVMTVGDNATITAANEGVTGVTFGTGNVTANIGENVTIDPDDFGINMQSALGDATVNGGAGLTILITNTDGDATAVGINAVSGRAADAAPGDQAVEIFLGENTTITIDDGAGGEADGASGIAANAAGALGGVDIEIVDGLNIDITGTNAVGIAAQAVGGTVLVETNGGTIDVTDLDGVDAAGNHAYSAGISAVSGTGNVEIRNGSVTTIDNTGTAYGLYAVTGGAGTARVESVTAVTSSGFGIYAETVDGNAVVQNGGAVVADLNDGIFITSATGVVQANNTASVTSLQSAGIHVQALGAGVAGINNSGAVTAAEQGLWAFTQTSDVLIVNSGAVTANTSGSFFSGILGSSNNGNVSVQLNSGSSVAGTADDGVVAQTVFGGDTSVVNNGGGGIGSAGDFVSGVGVRSEALGLSPGHNAFALLLGTAGIYAVDGGVNAETRADGNATVITGGANTITTSGLTSYGIRAVSDGGAVQVQQAGTITSAGSGIITQTSGVGGTLINANTITATGVDLAAVSATSTGNGSMNISVINGSTVAGTAGSGIRVASAGGAVTVNVGQGGVGAATALLTGRGSGGNGWVVDLNNIAGATTTLNVASNGVIRSGDAAASGYNDLAIRAIGGALVINNGGRINGVVDAAGASSLVFNNSSLNSWHTTGLSTFSAGADTLNNTGAIFTNAGGVATTIAFGAGADTFINSGLLVVGEPTLAASTLTLTGLETWTNSGRVVFGSSGTTAAAASDGQINDSILAAGTTFTGSGASRLVMDVNLGATVQANCATLTAADCFGLTGGSTAGATQIRLNDIGGANSGSLNTGGIVLVDVSGAGTTAATHFALDPTSPGWRADANSADGVIDKGLFFYDLVLDGKQHKLVGLPDADVFEFSTVGTAAQSAWYTTTGVWLDRQADLRQQIDGIDGTGAGVWMKIAGSTGQRDRTSSYDFLGTTYGFDTSYDQNTVALIGGLDFMGGGSGSAWVVGGQIGYVDSDVDFDASSTLTSLEGMTLGVYGTYVSGAFFVDGIVNANMLDYDHQNITLAPAGSNTFSGEVNSLGVQVEGGWTVALGSNGFFEPLATLSYLTTDIDSAAVPGSIVEWDDQTSLRASLGGRLGLNADHGAFSTQWALTARYWNEFEGDNGLTIDNGGADLDIRDDFSGSFGELGASVNVFSGDDRFSGFLNIGTKFNDDLTSVDASLGIRWRW
ncbi:MAG: hypothetical protein EON95_08875 [Caulobacteraceae bacterium]|nr:MAG: hypothetical protein EON95_08875 [Caulobacteraceae bacterium]